ncbi:MAG: hypothetical protein WC470_01280 [Candidatus Paceibacterota bacterium]
MDKLFSNKKIVLSFFVILICVLSFFVFFKFQKTYALDNPVPFSCAVRSSACNSGEVAILNLQALTNSHAELSSQSNYSYKICCSGTDIGNSCAIPHAVVLKLSAETSAHVQETGAYANEACLSNAAAKGTMACVYTSVACETGYICLASISGANNSHIGDCNAYITKVCCKTGTTGPATPPLPKWHE